MIVSQGGGEDEKIVVFQQVEAVEVSGRGTPEACINHGEEPVTK
jgi:hypothetical protein